MNERFDVVVVGAGSAGSSAAISAARRGARTLLVDRLPFLGGTSTAVLDTFYAFYTPGEKPRRVVGGIGWEVTGRLTAAGVAFERPNTYGAGTGVTYDPEALKVVWERLVEDARVEVLLHTWATGVRMHEGRIHSVRLWNKGGESVVEAGAIVDASGDADLCAMAGVPYEDASSTPNLQSLSTIFRVANVDLDRAAKLPKTDLWALMRKAAESGDYRLPRLEGSWHRTPFAGVVTVHMTRIPNVDATDPRQLTRAEIEGRRQVQEYHRFLRDLVPGFERSVVVATSPAIGVRESRRVIGDYRLTRDDVLEANRFDDEIALCGAPIEDHVAARFAACCQQASKACSLRDGASRPRTMHMRPRDRWPPAWRWARRPAPRRRSRSRRMYCRGLSIRACCAPGWPTTARYWIRMSRSQTSSR